MSGNSPFMIMALPRSRTAWTSHFLTYGEARCGHDVGVECGSIGEFLGNFQSGFLSGSCETGAMIAWKIIKKEIPSMKFVVVRRPTHEVWSSLTRWGIAGDERQLVEKAGMLSAISASPGAVTIDWLQLNDPSICRRLFEHCLGIEMDVWHYQQLANVNIQINMPERIERLKVNQPRLLALKEEVIARNRQIGGGPQCLGLQ